MGIKDSLGIKSKLGVKNKLGIARTPGIKEKAGTKVPQVGVQEGSATLAPSFVESTGKVVLEGKALLPQKPALAAKPVLAVKPPAPKVFYDCSRCPGYCCSYPRIEVKPSDVRRLAAFHGISVEKAERKFTRIYMDDGKPERILRHQKDTVYDTICRFFDTDLRRCTIYEGRPQVCREYPNGRHCGYYTFIKFERKHQDDDTFIPSA